MSELTLPLDRQIDEQLQTAPIGWIGTVRPDGAPHTVPVWFHWDGDAFLLFSQPNDQKLRNLRHSPLVTFAIPLSPDATSVSIFHGHAELLEGREPDALPPEYVAKYRDRIDAYGWNEAEMAQQYSVPVRFRPSKFISW